MPCTAPSHAMRVCCLSLLLLLQHAACFLKRIPQCAATRYASLPLDCLLLRSFKTGSRKHVYT